MTKIDRSILGVAGEFAVAAELCRQDIYAQLTLGNQKRVDLLTMDRGGLFRKIEVKAKQGPTWPGVKGIPPGASFLVFVDFAKTLTERPDFFVLSATDWHNLASAHVADYNKKHPGRTAYLDEDNCPVHPEELKNEKPFRGCSVRVVDVELHREAWSKIESTCVDVTAVPEAEADELDT